MSNKAVSRPTPWRNVVILCRKCGKKLDGGFGRKRKESLKTALRQTLLTAGRRRDIRILRDYVSAANTPGGRKTYANSPYPKEGDAS